MGLEAAGAAALGSELLWHEASHHHLAARSQGLKMHQKEKWPLLDVMLFSKEAP